MRPVSVLIAGGLLIVGWRAYRGLGGKNSLFDVLATDAAMIGATIMSTPASSMDISQQGLDAIAKREGGFEAYKYRDASGYSIGYGHFIKPGESFPEPLPLWRGLELLRDDAKIAADAVRGRVKVALTQNQFDALVSFVYNVGVGAFAKSTLLTRLNNGDYAGAAAQFAVWNKSQGQTLPALVVRRQSESNQFLT